MFMGKRIIPRFVPGADLWRRAGPVRNSVRSGGRQVRGTVPRSIAPAIGLVGSTISLATIRLETAR